MRQEGSIGGKFFIAITIWFAFSEAWLQPVAADEMETLNTTVAQPTNLSDLTDQDNSSLAMYSNGNVAAFYSEALGKQPRHYKMSTDSGATWEAPRESLYLLGGGTCDVALPDGNVLTFLTGGSWSTNEAEARVAPLSGPDQNGWLTLRSTLAWFNDDFTGYKVSPTHAFIPTTATNKQTHLTMSTWPTFADDKSIVLPNGDLLAVIQGFFKEDTKARTPLCRSTNRGHKWHCYSTAAIEEHDPDPDPAGWHLGYAEPTVALLPNEEMVCVVVNRWHDHTDSSGRFHCSLKDPPTEQVALRVDKRHNGRHTMLETSMKLSEIERQPIVLEPR